MENPSGTVQHQVQVLNNIVRLGENFAKDGPTRRKGKGPSFYEDRLKTLHDLWDNFSTTHNELLSQLPLEDEYFKHDTYGRCKEQYDKARERIQLAKISDFLPDNNQPTSDTVTPMHGTSDLNTTKKGAIPKHKSTSTATAENEQDTIPQLSENNQPQIPQTNTIINTNAQSTYRVNINEQEYLRGRLDYLTRAVQHNTTPNIPNTRPINNESSEGSTQLRDLLVRELRNADRVLPNVVKLPPIQIPKFNGEEKNWPPFIDLFNSIINNNTRLSDVEKLRYLMSYLDTQPLTLIQHLSLTNDNYRSALSILTNRYENKRIMISRYLNTVTNFGGCRPLFVETP
ncbi:hypothetical protein DMENIID0001_158400 [Sergentomyia squamirostris]